ncbi:uncharacterized protein LOC142985891 [Anticarsia gemmatalis]|uniref:uncharacterized protein LOC142985891 n=1 Tax=Anticarsia gemmatalis TaxID=129554 RepID=UPI003F7701C4
MYTGPNLQNDIFTLLLEWRRYKVAIAADCEKMFRAIWINEDDQPLQRIIWRDNSHDQLQEYQLTTVTYGTKAAPYLAMMTLRQLASNKKERFPEAAQIVENNFYMDDLILAVPSIEDALKIKADPTNLMKAGGFNLRKWKSNYKVLSENSCQEGQCNFDLTHTKSTKTLGLYWNPEKDDFVFQCKINKQDQHTKRSLLSAISQLFDRLGWLTPLSTKMKLLFQEVWETNMAWDDKLPKNIHQEWQSIKCDLVNINNVEIPRWLGYDDTCRLELHGFCDASQKAYGCVIYIKVIKQNKVDIKLIVGKSRLVPCKKEVSLPRLELCGALLLSEVMIKIKQALSPDVDIKVHGWTDSMAVLGWLQGNPDRWKPFVSNRVRKIVEVMPLALRQVCRKSCRLRQPRPDCKSTEISSNMVARPSMAIHHRQFYTRNLSLHYLRRSKNYKAS